MVWEVKTLRPMQRQRDTTPQLPPLEDKATIHTAEHGDQVGVSLGLPETLLHPGWARWGGAGGTDSCFRVYILGADRRDVSHVCKHGAGGG